MNNPDKEEHLMSRNSCSLDPKGTPLKDETRVEHLQTMVEALWSLLDDIDTASDMIKPTSLEGYKAFYRYVLKRAAKRFEQLESDGYGLFLPSTTAED